MQKAWLRLPRSTPCPRHRTAPPSHDRNSRITHRPCPWVNYCSDTQKNVRRQRTNANTAHGFIRTTCSDDTSQDSVELQWQDPLCDCRRKGGQFGSNSFFFLYLYTNSLRGLRAKTTLARLHTQPGTPGERSECHVQRNSSNRFTSYFDGLSRNFIITKQKQ